jgi:hypothetical protein
MGLFDKANTQTQKAWKLFKSFHNKDPRNGQLVKIAMDKPDEALEVGKFYGIAYIAEGEIYFHKFKKTDRPLVFVSSDGKQIYILKGGYRFTDRGFIG